jgi:hypothetical protein
MESAMEESDARLTNVIAGESMGFRTEVGYAAVTGAGSGLVFGLLLHFGLGVMGDVAGIFTAGASASPVVGWLFHMGVSTLFGGLWGGVADIDAVASYARSPSTGLTLGALYGLVLWFLNVGLILPLWVNYAIGVEFPFPYLVQIGSLMPMLGHLLWGAILGFAFPLTRY